MKPDEAKELEAPTDVAGQVERVVRRRLHPHDNKFHQGNGDDQKHYWLTPPDLMQALQTEFVFDFDPCPYPKPDDFDGLTMRMGILELREPPFRIHHAPRQKEGADRLGEESDCRAPKRQAGGVGVPD